MALKRPKQHLLVLLPIMEDWLSGRRHLIANEAYRNVSEVRILYLPHRVCIVQKSQKEQSPGKRKKAV